MDHARALVYTALTGVLTVAGCGGLGAGADDAGGGVGHVDGGRQDGLANADHQDAAGESTPAGGDTAGGGDHVTNDGDVGVDAGADSTAEPAPPDGSSDGAMGDGPTGDVVGDKSGAEAGADGGSSDAAPGDGVPGDGSGDGAGNDGSSGDTAGDGGDGKDAPIDPPGDTPSDLDAPADVLADAGPDLPTDTAADAPADTGTDAVPEGLADAAPDAPGADAPPDAPGADAPPDAPGADAPGPDAPTDAGGEPAADAPPPGCVPGGAQCNNCVDDDGDGQTDYFDSECVSPLDNDESSFATGIPGDNMDACKQDCFFDGDSGSGNDKCEWNLHCDPANPGGTDCPYDPGFKKCPGTQPQKCLDVCLPKTPNGCDCFGCCTVTFAGDGGTTTRDVFLAPTCKAEFFGDPVKCPGCTPNDACVNSCDPCEVCVGKPAPDPSCGGSDGGPPPPQCNPGVTACGPGGVDPAMCPSGTVCITGCCIIWAI